MGGYWQGMLALLLARGVNAGACAAMAAPDEDVVELLRAPSGREALSEVLECRVGDVDWSRFAEQVARVESVGADAICCWDRDYPNALRSVDPPAPLVFYKGDRHLLRTRGIAIVGTRKPTPGGVSFARRLSRDLAAAGICVVSGLARGIDTAAHAGALGYPGRTLAVIGTGVDVPYPAENAELMVDVARDGCVLSEQLMGMHPSPHVFPRRNRLISALSHAVVVVEGGVRSGALITARWALEQGRDVGAVPGFPGDYRSAGPNQLLRQGAFVVEGITDVLEAIPMLSAAVPKHGVVTESDTGTLGPSAAAVLKVVGTAPVDVDAVAQTLAMNVTDVQHILVSLELDGLVVRAEGGGYTRVAR